MLNPYPRFVLGAWILVSYSAVCRGDALPQESSVNATPSNIISPAVASSPIALTPATTLDQPRGPTTDSASESPIALQPATSLDQPQFPPQRTTSTQDLSVIFSSLISAASQDTQIVSAISGTSQPTAQPSVLILGQPHALGTPVVGSSSVASVGPVVGLGASHTVAYSLLPSSSGVVIDGQTLGAGSTITAAGHTIVMPSASGSALGIIIDGSTIAISATYSASNSSSPATSTGSSSPAVSTSSTSQTSTTQRATSGSPTGSPAATPTPSSVGQATTSVIGLWLMLSALIATGMVFL